MIDISVDDLRFERVTPGDLKNSPVSADFSFFDHQLFSTANPFWQQGQAQVFSIGERTHVIGFLHPEFHVGGSPVAYFGYWKPIDDVALQGRLLSALERWASRAGATGLVGPIHFKTAFQYRLRTSDFGGAPFWGEPVNLPCAGDLLRSHGYEVCQKYGTDFIDNLDKVRAEAEVRLPTALKRSLGLTIVPFSESLFYQHRHETLLLVNKVFAKNFAFTPLNEFDMSLFFGGVALKQVCRATSMFLFDGKRLAGIWLNFPHPNDPRCLLVKTVGIDDQVRNAGRSFVHALQYVFRHSEAYDRIAFCLMTDDNQVHRLTRKYCERRREYALYFKSIYPDPGI